MFVLLSRSGSESSVRQTEGAGVKDPAAGEQAHQQDRGGDQEGSQEIHTSRSEQRSSWGRGSHVWVCCFSSARAPPAYLCRTSAVITEAG